MRLSLLTLIIYLLSFYVLGGRRKKLPKSSDPSFENARRIAASFFRPQNAPDVPTLVQPQPPAQLEEAEHLDDLLQPEDSHTNNSIQAAEELLANNLIAHQNVAVGNHQF